MRRRGRGRGRGRGRKKRCYGSSFPSFFPSFPVTSSQHQNQPHLFFSTLSTHSKRKKNMNHHRDRIMRCSIDHHEEERNRRSIINTPRPTHQNEHRDRIHQYQRRRPIHLDERRDAADLETRQRKLEIISQRRQKLKENSDQKEDRERSRSRRFDSQHEPSSKEKKIQEDEFLQQELNRSKKELKEARKRLNEIQMKKPVVQTSVCPFAGETTLPSTPPTSSTTFPSPPPTLSAVTSSPPSPTLSATPSPASPSATPSLPSPSFIDDSEKKTKLLAYLLQMQMNLKKQGETDKARSDHEQHLQEQQRITTAKKVSETLTAKRLPTDVDPWRQKTAPSTSTDIKLQYKATRACATVHSHLKHLSYWFTKVDGNMTKQEGVVMRHRSAEVANELNCEIDDPRVNLVSNEIRTIFRQNPSNPPPKIERSIPPNIPVVEWSALGNLLQEVQRKYDRISAISPGMSSASVYEAFDYLDH